MVITKDLATENIINALSEQFSYIETERHKEIDKLLDFYEGLNTEDYVNSYFGTETLNANFGGYTSFGIDSAETDENGYGSFEFAPPSGYYALCTKNLAEYG